MALQAIELGEAHKVYDDDTEVYLKTDVDTEMDRIHSENQRLKNENQALRIGVTVAVGKEK